MSADTLPPTDAPATTPAAPPPLAVLLVDDEPLARLRLRSLLADLTEPATRVCGEAGDADAALALVRAMAVDVVLLDIQLPGCTGLALAQALQALPQPPAVVFVTAHTEHALQAFELAAVDYLTKPVKRERLLAALQRVAQRRPVTTPAPAATDAAVLVVHDRGRVLRLPLAEVLYLKAALKYVTLRTPGQAYVLDDSLTELEQRLEALNAGFLRVHRNALVARQAVRALEFRLPEPGSAEPAEEGWAVQVAPLGEWLAVSRRQLAAVREALAGG
jgi:two-component system response regulator AlgR